MYNSFPAKQPVIVHQLLAQADNTTPTISSTPSPVPTDTPTATPIPTHTNTPTPTSVPANTATPTPTATNTPVPSATPTRTPTPTPTKATVYTAIDTVKPTSSKPSSTPKLIQDDDAWTDSKSSSNKILGKNTAQTDTPSVVRAGALWKAVILSVLCFVLFAGFVYGVWRYQGKKREV